MAWAKCIGPDDKELDRTVALKILREDVIEDPLALQRFKQELQLASRITHPNILRIHDLGECRGMKFISMQYVEGGDLYQILKKRWRASALSRHVDNGATV